MSRPEDDFVSGLDEPERYNELAQKRTPTGGDVVVVPRAAIAWLMGEGPDPAGFSFGEFPEGHPKPPGAFWWRTVFRDMLASAPARSPLAPVVEGEVPEDVRALATKWANTTLALGEHATVARLADLIMADRAAHSPAPVEPGTPAQGEPVAQGKDGPVTEPSLTGTTRDQMVRARYLVNEYDEARGVHEDLLTREMIDRNYCPTAVDILRKLLASPLSLDPVTREAKP